MSVANPTDKQAENPFPSYSHFPKLLIFVSILFIVITTIFSFFYWFISTKYHQTTENNNEASKSAEKKSYSNSLERLEDIGKIWGTSTSKNEIPAKDLYVFHDQDEVSLINLITKSENIVFRTKDYELTDIVTEALLSPEGKILDITIKSKNIEEYTHYYLNFENGKIYTIDASNLTCSLWCFNKTLGTVCPVLEENRISVCNTQSYEKKVISDFPYTIKDLELIDNNTILFSYSDQKNNHIGFTKITLDGEIEPELIFDGEGSITFEMSSENRNDIVFYLDNYSELGGIYTFNLNTKRYQRIYEQHFLQTLTLSPSGKYITLFGGEGEGSFNYIIDTYGKKVVDFNYQDISKELVFKDKTIYVHFSIFDRWLNDNQLLVVNDCYSFKPTGEPAKKTLFVYDLLDNSATKVFQRNID